MRQAMKAMEYIRENYDKPDLSLNNICAYLAISTSHFSTIFEEATGETFMEVLIRIRMEKAKELLEQTNLKNYEIAERVGFSDPHYFSMSFKKDDWMHTYGICKGRNVDEKNEYSKYHAVFISGIRWFRWSSFC